MTDLMLENDEGILLQTADVICVDGKSEIEISELYLTNKNLIEVCEKTKGFFSKTEITTDKIPLSSIRIAGGVVQVEYVDDKSCGDALQFIFVDGKRVLFLLPDDTPKNIYTEWKNTIIDVIRGVDRNNQNDTSKASQNTSFCKTVFCNQCGKKIDVNAKFCPECGAPVYIDFSMNKNQDNRGREYSSAQQFRRDKRNTVYEGILHRCPNCVELLKSFTSTCPTCGYEIRDTYSANSIREFERRLYEIEARVMPQEQDEDSFMKKVFGKDFSNDKEREEEALRQFKNQKREEKINLIINYPVPNAKEDLLEFAFLIFSNLKQKEDITGDLTKAWVAKFDQVYNKAEIVLKGNEALAQIKALHHKSCNSVKLFKFFFIMAFPFIFALFFSLGILEGMTTMFLVSMAAILIMIIISIIYIKKLYK